MSVWMQMYIYVVVLVWESKTMRERERNIGRKSESVYESIYVCMMQTEARRRMTLESMPMVSDRPHK